MILYIALVTLFSVSNIYIANIVYILVIAKKLTIDQKNVFIKNKPAQLFLIAFLSWVTISSVMYIMKTQVFSIRVLIQYIFTLQYIMLIVPFEINVKKFEYYLYRLVLFESIVIISLFIFLYLYYPITLSDDLWATKYLPGWPNSTIIPLLVGFWLTFRDKKNIWAKAIIFCALILTESRAALLGIVFILCYYALNHVKLTIKNIVLFLFLVSFLIGGICYWIYLDPLLVKKMIVSWDRIDIFMTTMNYLETRPLLGYGGNTLEQITIVEMEYKPIRQWNHTHNWILEIMLRYGIVGVLLFTGFIYSLYCEIIDKEKRFMFVLFIILALFQTYIRDFVFLFFLLYFSMNISIHEKNKFVDIEE